MNLDSLPPLPEPGAGHVHEAAHLASALSITSELDTLDLGTHLVENVHASDRAGAVRFVVPDVLGTDAKRRWWAGQLVIRLAGYLAEGRPDWPPRYADACRMDGPENERLGLVIEAARLDEGTYHVLATLARVMDDDPEYRLRVRSLARLLVILARPVSGDELEALRRSKETGSATTPAPPDEPLA